ncbi:MAG: response regulator [Planctomycetes bacterium]|nr:response regulator [Planctomycetota bacterium]
MARLDGPRRALVVSPSFVLRNSYATALEDDGHAVSEAATDDEVLWRIVAAGTGDAPPIDVIIADLGTPGVQALLSEVRSSSARPPALVLVVRPGRLPPALLDARLGEVDLVADARDLGDLRAAVARALGRPRRPAPALVVAALEGEARRAALVAELEARGASVIDLADGLELLEGLRRGDATPDVLLLDARLPRLDGLDALAELARQGPAVVVVQEGDEEARARAAALGAVVVDRRAAPALLAVRALSLRRPPTGRARRRGRPVRDDAPTA